MIDTRETKQKRIIEQEISKSKFMFNADEIYERVVKIDKNIGIATVYRFLKDLRKNREIHSYICNRKNIYSLKNMSHSHFTCESCGKIEHIKIENLDFLKKFVSGDLCHFQIEVSGLCEQCKRKQSI